ncbi:hypothetical protein PDESU_04246 [Pontiella desulfatans]|uniref:Uncharacterized protein n=1 Tax=Pontiella desulfatans TaxID=2750659 RepID=A0A6C2U816_PONDE|nr:hypothetical protein [Pontiella desulfatans]VGO15661.1 hypothetical protein PDESU_04246 [Pontiella desulfatans]
MKKILTRAWVAGLLGAVMAGTANAEVIYLDFYDDGTTNTSPETYNVLNSTAGSGQTHPVATAGTGLSMTGLVDTNGVTTGADVTLHSYSSFRTAGGPAVGGTYAHQPVSGIATNASQDSFWVNDQGNAASFGFILTFTGLTGSAYDISMLAGAASGGGTWSVTTGSGDSDTEAYSTAQTEVQQWTEVVPVGGTIELRSIDDGSGNWQNATLSFVSLEEVELANSLLALSSGTLSLNLDAPDTAIDGTIEATFVPGSASTDVEILSMTADAGFSASVTSTILGTANPAEDITVTFDNSSIGLASGETTNSTLVVTWTESGSGVNNTSEVALDVIYTDEPSSLVLAPTTLSLELSSPATTVGGTIAASFVEGNASADVEVISVTADAGFSVSPASFTLATANTSEDISVTFNNATIGLAQHGETTNTTMVVTWAEVGSGVTNTTTADLDVTYIVEFPELEHGAIIFEADTNNTTLLSSYNVNGTMSLSGATGSLVLTNAHGGFNSTGFAGTESIETQLGRGLTTDDTVTMSLTVDSISGTWRANGVTFGMAGSVSDWPTVTTTNLMLGVKAANQGSDVQLRNSWLTNGNLGFDAQEASMLDGFSIYLTADKDGYTFVIYDIIVANSTVSGAVNGATWGMVSGSFSGNEFVDYFSDGRLFYGAQRFNTDPTTDPLVSFISDATISVSVPDAGEFTGVTVSNGSLVVEFTGSVGRGYIVETTENLSIPNSWETATNITALPESPMTLELPTTKNAAFFRILND